MAAMTGQSCIPGQKWWDESAYESLHGLERAGFAWEWLRRRRDFQEAALRAIDRRGAYIPLEEEEGALDWHLHAFEDPRLAAPSARPIWAAERNPWVVNAQSERSSSPEDCLDLAQLSRFAKLLINSGAQHLLLSDGLRSIRLDIEGASLASGPVQVNFTLNGVRTLERSLIVLRRLRSVAEQRRFVGSLYPPVRRARRLIALLRTHDALEASASQADIAEAFLSKSFERKSWRTNCSSVRSQVQRLVRSARHMADGAFWNLLE